MKIWTDKIPKERKKYLTEGKKYDVITLHPQTGITGRGFEFIDDNGKWQFSVEFNSSHINGNWNVEE